jgi:flagellar biosynthesis/type III secretory pathway M-ring protein FliF/YscJ
VEQMVDEEKREDIVKDVNVKNENVTRKEDPSMVGATFIKYAAYIIIVLIVLYFLIRYVFPMF